MELHIIGSGSSGNSYALADSKGSILLLEAGCPLKAIKQAISYQVKNIVGCVITHEHGDHAKYAKDLLDKTMAPVLASIGTIDALGIKARRDLRPLRAGKTVYLGEYSVMPILLQHPDENGGYIKTHDAAEPVCFEIHHPEMGLLVFATDTYSMPCRFPGANHMMIECNYDLEILNQNTRDGRISKHRRDRTIMSHMSLANCQNYLKTADLSSLNDIILIHISKDNGDPERFKHLISQSTGKNTLVATPGLSTQLNIN